MTRLALVVALSLLPALAQANPKQEPRPRKHGLTLELPEFPVIPPIPAIELPDFDVDLDLPGMLARNDRDEDEEKADSD